MSNLTLLAKILRLKELKIVSLMPKGVSSYPPRT